MKKLFTTLYGSKLYGTDTPESDTDYKHLVLPSLDDLLIGKQIKNEVHKTNKEKFTKNSSEDFDEEFIPLQVFARDFLNGQTYALEMCFAIDFTNAHQTIYDQRIISFCHELREKFLTSNITALVGYAVNQANLYSLKGERLNTIRLAKQLFEEFPSELRPLDIEEEFKEKAKLLESTYFKITEYAIDHEGTMRPCIKLLEKILPYTSTFQTSLNVIMAQLKKYGSRADIASIDNVDWKAVAHSLRILDEGISLLKNKKLKFPFDKKYIDFLLAVKNGNFLHKEVTDLINLRLADLKSLETNSKLPKKTYELEEKLNIWLVVKMKDFYDL